MTALLGILLAFVSAAHVVSIQLAGSGINEAVLYHLIVGLEGAGFGEYRTTIVLAIGLLLATVAYGLCCYYLVMRLKRKHLSIPLALTAIITSLGINPGFTGVFKTSRAYFAEEPMAPLPDDLVYDQVTALRNEVTQPKNLVLIYAESLESGYFDGERFPGLVPRLSDMRDKSLSFSRVESLPGMTWTIGGMVASQCGIPLVTANNIRNTRIETETFLSEAYCLGDILTEHGYQLHYMGGADTTFADKNLFYESHGTWQVNGRAQLSPRLEDPNYINQWGLYDDSMLEMAKSRFDTLASDSKPFALTLLTLDTHHPNGHISRRCDMPYGDGNNPILNAVHCSDQLLADFIEYVQSADAPEETLVVVVSDHLALPNTASDLLNQKPRLNLFMMPGIPPNSLGEDIDTTKPASLMDVGPTLLHALGFEVQALGYGRNLLARDKTFIEAHSDPAAAIRERFATVRNLWQYPSLHEGLEVNTAERRAAIGTHEFTLPALVTLQDTLRIDRTQQADQLLEHMENANTAMSFLWFDECATLPDALVDKDASEPNQTSLCLLAGKGQDISQPAIVLQEEGTHYLPLSDLAPFLDAPKDKQLTQILLHHLHLKNLGGDVVLVPEPETSEDGAIDFQDDTAPTLAILAKAIPQPDYAFIAWMDIHDNRRLSAEIIVPPWQVATLVPEFDVSVSSPSPKPEYRSAWTAALIKGERVLSDHLSPGGTQDSVSRMRLPLSDGSELDARATGGFLAKNWENAYLRRNGEHLMTLQRGINMWVQTPSGDELHHRFDTYGEPSASDALIETLRQVPHGSLIVFVTTDEFSAALSEAAVAHLHKLGVLLP
jgi:phosphoglycerol transferase